MSFTPTGAVPGSGRLRRRAIAALVAAISVALLGAVAVRRARGAGQDPVAPAPPRVTDFSR
ncbi:hypothetical protein [uncultured Gordonia sp.]|uniref:hypothetical protein n=1 Tax=Gordonia sp. (in: high G+C Gram-positive bacteria) TaxID=84139 RepID=UPI000F9ED617|nr:hypothetical protein [uncultured Gordonia sp.]RUP36317.1 MAG: hypothetical protein EKK60_15330 [Gordonia sp. (in: high G+C Gram-positive bacteria)]